MIRADEKFRKDSAGMVFFLNLSFCNHTVLAAVVAIACKKKDGPFVTRWVAGCRDGTKRLPGSPQLHKGHAAGREG